MSGRRIPDFFVIGAAKCATTSLCVGLGRHPGIFIPGRKELNFFSDDEKFKRGVEWYTRYFSDATSDQVLGEGSVSYSFHSRYPDTAARIHQIAPNSKLIYIIRNPLEQIVSLYLQFAAAGVVRHQLSKAIRVDEIHLDAARYFRQISEYRKYWDDDSIKIAFFDDWKADQGAVLRDCATFLGASPAFQFEREVKPFAVTKGQAVDRRMVRRLRHLPFLGWIRDSLPLAVRRRLKAVLKKEITETPKLTSDDIHYIRENLAEDTAQILEYAGRPKLWDLSNDDNC